VRVALDRLRLRSIVRPAPSILSASWGTLTPAIYVDGGEPVGDHDPFPSSPAKLAVTIAWVSLSSAEVASSKINFLGRRSSIGHTERLAKPKPSDLQVFIAF
jgi:hypothetical protein